MRGRSYGYASLKDAKLAVSHSKTAITPISICRLYPGGDEAGGLFQWYDFAEVIPRNCEVIETYEYSTWWEGYGWRSDVR